MLAARAPPSKPRSFLWRDGWIGFRNRLIADPRFQRWAAASPLTRLIARRRARALFDLCAGFVYSQILLACVRLRLFEILAEGPHTPESLSGPLGLSADAAIRLLRGAVALRLVRALPANRFALDDLGAALLGNPSVAALVEHHSLLYDDLRDPVALLRGEAPTRLSRFWPYAGDAPQRESTDESLAQKENYAAYSRLMSQSHALVAEDILDAYPIARHRRLLDVGGGEGAFVAAAAARAPQLELMLFDLDPVAAQARPRLEAQGLAGRVQTIGGSFLCDQLPSGADVVSLVRVVHDHDDESVIKLLCAVREALPIGGVLLVGEPMAETPGAEPMGDAYFGFYLLAMGRGAPRTKAALTWLLQSAGFGQISVIPTPRPLLTSLITATRL
jgi:demethylspheroidene O-methyltransferase